MENYLEETQFADYRSQAIQDLLPSLITEDNTTETIRNIYYYVRDKILFGSSPVGLKASETLALKRGVSQTKGNLAIALFRGAKIPARYRIVDFNDAMSLRMVDMITYFTFPLVKTFQTARKFVHVIPQIYHNDQWLNCDPIFDIELFTGFKAAEAMGLKNIDSIEWNEKTGVSPQEFMIKRELFVLDNADKIFTRIAKASNFFYDAGYYKLVEKNYEKARIKGAEILAQTA